MILYHVHNMLGVTPQQAWAHGQWGKNGFTCVALFSCPEEFLPRPQERGI